MLNRIFIGFDMNERIGFDELNSAIHELESLCSIAETTFETKIICWTLKPNTKSDEEFIIKLLNEAKIEYRLI